MKNINTCLLLFILFCFVSCKSRTTSTDETTPEVKTPVTVTTIQTIPMSETVNLNAVSTFQKKNTVKSNITGYIEKVYANNGDFVNAGKPLFIIKTKEAEALSGIRNIDTLFHFKGTQTISAASSGIITEVTKQLGDYVAEGDQLAIIAEQASFVFLLNVPFELNKYAATGTSCTIILPDSTHIKGTIISKLSTIDPVSQTQSYVLKPQTNNFLPENLLAIVQLNKSIKQNAQVLDKSCVLTDETMENFWVMKLINDSTAVRSDIKKGMTTETKVEILAPQFGKEDRIVNSGNYGLPDTAFVNIIDKK